MSENVPSAESGEIVDAEFQAYPRPSLQEPSRPPSRGGNTRSRHRHAIQVGDEWYSFFALGAQKWARVGDRISFRYQITPEGYRNILPETFRAVDPKGKEQVRGIRGSKPKLRTAPARLPASRREQRD